MGATLSQLQRAELDFELKDIFYQRNAGEVAADGLTPDQFRAALVDRFGEAGVKSLESQGLLNILDLNDPAASQDPATILDPTNPAWYDPSTGEAFFIPQFIRSAEDAVAAVLHEVGEHHGLQGMLGDRAWRTLKGRVAQLAREGKNDIAAAWAGVLDMYPEFAASGYDTNHSAAISDDRFMHEVIAKVGETAAGRRSSLWRDLLAAVNRFLLKMGLGRQINKNELADLVEGSLRRVMGGQGPDGGPGGRMDMNARRVWRGARTINDFLVPETPEYADSTSGDLAYVVEGNGIPAIPIRMHVGVAREEHRGFGMMHVADNARRDDRRAPQRDTDDIAEDMLREALRVMSGALDFYH